MFSPRAKSVVLLITGMNAVATSLYFNYLFFHMRNAFGFSNRENLALGACSGLLYAVGVWFGGKFAQQRGYVVALKLGCSTMALALAAGCLMRSPAGHAAVVVFWTLGMCLTWPCLEAITCEGESPARLPRLLGIYNLVWSTSLGGSFFFGGGLIEALGPRSIFLLPAGLHAAQVVLLFLLARWPATGPQDRGETLAASPVPAEERRRSALPPKAFLAMAWVANPFAYVAINAVIPVIPEVAHRFGFSPATAGFLCSVWMLARSAAFLWFWKWTGWHYRFRWLLAAYVAVLVCFATMLLSTNLGLLLVAQAVFGVAIALIYYSSLYYSMDLGDTKGEHGGFHEAALGLGLFGGPAIGAASLYWAPGSPNANAWAVSAALLAGLGWMLALQFRARGRARSVVPLRVAGEREAG